MITTSDLLGFRQHGIPSGRPRPVYNLVLAEAVTDYLRARSCVGTPS